MLKIFNALKNIFIFLLMIFFSVNVLGNASLFGVRINMLYLFVIYFAICLPYTKSVPLSLILGILTDAIYTYDSFGINTVIFVVTAITLTLFNNEYKKNSVMYMLAITSFFSVISILVSEFVISIITKSNFNVLFFVKTGVITAILNVIFILIIRYILDKIIKISNEDTKYNSYYM